MPRITHECPRRLAIGLVDALPRHHPQHHGVLAGGIGQGSGQRRISGQGVGHPPVILLVGHTRVADVVKRLHVSCFRFVSCRDCGQGLAQRFDFGVNQLGPTLRRVLDIGDVAQQFPRDVMR